MFTGSVFQLIIEVVSSWEVIAATIAIIIFLNIVFYFARAYRTPISIKKISIKKKKSKSETALEGPETSLSGSNTNDELGLEEA